MSLSNTIEFHCPGGYKLRVSKQASGKTLPCPVCRQNVTVPIQKDPLSDTGVMRILGDGSPPPPVMPVNQSPTTRPCPRCLSRVTESLAVCPACSCYLGTDPDYLRQMKRLGNEHSTSV